MIGMEPDEFVYVGLRPDGMAVKVFVDVRDARTWVSGMNATGEFGWHVVTVPFQPPQ